MTMLKKSMLILSLAAILVTGCAQEKPKAQEQPLPQAKPPVQVQTKSNEPVILGKKIIDKYKEGFGTNQREIIVEERRIQRTLPNGNKKFEIQYYDAKTNERIINYEPKKQTKTYETLKNEGKDVSDFKSH